jgi:predicted nucleic acid-binding protein
MGKRYTLLETNQLGNRDIFVDANVLIYLFWPTGQNNFENNYATVFKVLKSQGFNLFLDFLVISEVINKVIHFEYLNYCKNHHSSTNAPSKKKFRDSPEGSELLKDIYIIIKDNVLSNFSIKGKSLDKNDIFNFLEIDGLDFVDKAIVKICEENSFVLLTNDSDFIDCGIDILSGNKKLLK